MQQMNLFNTSSDVSGFRLDYMEIYNWGTFDSQIFRISPQGNNSLLTGANASGKSTLIDALLTLLVPLKKDRFYNQSSGTEKKGNRTEESYFYGYYGNQQIEGSNYTQTLKLRNRDSRSVLLITFKGVDEKILTLFQVRYVTGEDLKVVYGIGKTALNIADDLGDFDLKGQWRRSLEAKYNNLSAKKVIEFCSGPVEYGEKICDLFGMRSDKALTLFNQLVGVKVLDDLNLFVRYNMLEELPAEEKYLKLKDNFQNLTEAKNCIDKVNVQISQLKPIDELAVKIISYDEEIRKTSEKKQLAAYWYAKKTVDLCKESIENIHKEKESLNNALSLLGTEAERLDKSKTELNVAIQNDATGLQISKLTEEIQNLNPQKEERNRRYDSYSRLTERLELIKDPDATEFGKNREEAKSMLNTLGEQIQTARTELSQSENIINDKKKEIEEIIVTLNSLQKHQNNIAGRESEIRDEILSYTHARTDDIPFIGELIKVKDEELEWESSIEKILHNFALRLIVPDVYYDAVNEYVNSNNLRGRIVYHHYKDYASLKQMTNRNNDDNGLFNKLDFKSENVYAEWIEDVIYSEYNYNCVDSLEEFALYPEKVVTKGGLIKSVKGKHEKDDRPDRFKRSNYVLGWDNKEKIASLTQEVHKLQKEQSLLEDKKNKIQADIEQKNALLEAYNNLYYTFDSFSVIDWKSFAKLIQAKQEEIENLKESNDKLRTLKNQLDNVLLSLEENKKEQNRVIGKLAEINYDESQIKQTLTDNENSVSVMGTVDCSMIELENPELKHATLKTINSLIQAYQDELTGQKENLNRSKGIACGRIKNNINKFKNPPVEILRSYPDWSTDVLNLPDSEHLDLVHEYQKFYKRLVDDDLKSIEKRFNDYLHETLTNGVSAFRMFFTTWEKSIIATIEQLNYPLRGIDFDTRPSTYIQLSAVKKLDVEVAEFERMLLEAVPNLHEIDSIVDGHKIHYEEKIAPLIKRLEDPIWRKKVMDVRSWFTYEAEEFYKETGKRRKTYQSMGQLSGGEKAQLTYTIMGSAIAYQFGLTKTGCDSSFRFIAIDEAFKAQDETKARYLISLCRQLHLQLLVVTPSDNIHIVEDDISFVHYVERKGDKSVLVNMPILEFKAARQNYEND